ncbi:MAG: right-handed parallel beta-helix repeat-containing protein [Candidatus Eisenbacteria sp.]|nr:right-handed parallel beta-helix repeat-containing protein [Candidatus Eisenbacteria bacterium]
MRCRIEVVGAIFILLASGIQASADEVNLEDGVFIAHYVPQLEYSEAPENACGDYEQYAIANPEDQVNRIDADGTYSTWFVLAAWSEEKEFCGVQFGFGDYDPDIYPIDFFGICSPGGVLEICGFSWPGPNNGTAVVTTGIPWTGNYVPVYYFGGYAYAGETTIPLGIDNCASVPFGGFGNCEQFPEKWPAVCFGAMGINTEGLACDPTTPYPPPECACCIGEVCQILTQTDCLLAGGEWLSGIMSCDPNPCTASLYACCVGDVCQILSEEDCLIAGGEWRQFVTSCQPNPCVPQVYVVYPDGTGDFLTIQEAVYASVDGGVIELGDGTFTGQGNRDITYQGKAITIRSHSGDPEACVIDCEGSAQNARRGVCFSSGEDLESVLEGVTITHGYDGNFGGGGVICWESAATLVNCRFVDNIAVGGGAIACDFTDVPPTLTGCIFSGNVAGTYGGAVFCGSSSPTIINCTFYGNSAPSGGGICCEANSDLILENCIISFSTEGEAVLVTGSSSSATLTCCDIFGNAGGDWVGYIAPQQGINGNISAYPLFCDPGNGDFTLQSCSPCAPFSPPNPECDLIGACPVGCPGTPTLKTSWGAIKSMFRK